MSPDQAKKYTIRFDDADVAAAGRHAAQLRDDLRALDGTLDPRVEKPDKSSQDFGTTLVLVLGAPAAVALAKGLAKGIAAYLSRSRGTITIEADGKVVASGLTGKDAAAIATAFAAQRPKN